MCWSSYEKRRWNQQEEERDAFLAEHRWQRVSEEKPAEPEPAEVEEPERELVRV